MFLRKSDRFTPPQLKKYGFALEYSAGIIGDKNLDFNSIRAAMKVNQLAAKRYAQITRASFHIAQVFDTDAVRVYFTVRSLDESSAVRVLLSLADDFSDISKLKLPLIKTRCYSECDNIQLTRIE